MPFANGQRGRLYWRGDGRDRAPVLLLLNSLGTDFAMWDQVVPLLHDGFRVLRMDTRGHGASDVPAGDYSLPELAADALCVLDAAGARTASVCGLSLGGMMALQLALASPQRISRIVACNTSAQVAAQPWLDRAATVRRDGMGSIVTAVMSRFFSDGFLAECPPSLETVRATFLSTSPEGYAACCTAISSVDMIEQLGRLRQPALVINGRLDAATPPAEHGDRIAAALPDARTVVLEAGHISAVEQPGVFAAAVRSFLNEAA
jgi:3-oxoadipate enol-lactonase/4-carboxymuconolactone decarboxylase